jgi:CRISPR-associated protein Cas1
MKKLLNTLYVTLPDAYLAREDENVLVRIKDEIKFRIPIHNLESIVSFGYTGASPSLMSLCAQRGVGLSFITENGYFLARVTGRVNGNVLLRRKQYRMADNPEESLHLANHFIIGKIANGRSVLMRAIRDHEKVIQSEEVLCAISQLTRNLQKIENTACMESLRGIEGDSARTYFSVFDHLILTNKADFFFNERNKRPPLDNMNALLSFLYTLLAHDIESALESVGLDPAVGFLHTDRPGRSSLALDMMEELRPYLADRLALTLVNRSQVSKDGFSYSEAGGVTMSDETRKTVITTWQKRKQEEIIHPFLNEKISIGLIPYAQGMLLARFIRGDLDAYPPFFSK